MYIYRTNNVRLQKTDNFSLNTTTASLPSGGFFGCVWLVWVFFPHIYFFPQKWVYYNCKGQSVFFIAGDAKSDSTNCNLFKEEMAIAPENELKQFCFVFVTFVNSLNYIQKHLYIYKPNKP